VGRRGNGLETQRDSAGDGAAGCPPARECETAPSSALIGVGESEHDWTFAVTFAGASGDTRGFASRRETRANRNRILRCRRLAAHHASDRASARKLSRRHALYPLARAVSRNVRNPIGPELQFSNGAALG